MIGLHFLSNFPLYNYWRRSTISRDRLGSKLDKLLQTLFYQPKYILSHEYKSIVEDTAKLQKETEYKQQKIIVRKLIKK